MITKIASAMIKKTTASTNAILNNRQKPVSTFHTPGQALLEPYG